MRFIIVTIALALIVFWIVRAARGRNPGQPLPKEQQSAGKAPAQVQEMVSCVSCGLHLPKSDSVSGKRGIYCCLEHQHQAET
jgi:uncharacterized protein